MAELLLVLSAIALIDSLTLLPLAVLPLTVALGSARPFRAAFAFIAGVYAAYFLCGLPILGGAEVLIDHLGAFLDRLWNRPNVVELCLQIVIGLLLILSAGSLLRRKASPPPPQSTPPAAAGPLFLLGATLVVVGIPGAVPYLAAIERIVSSEVPGGMALAFLGSYNLVFVLPLLGLVALRAVLGDRAQPCFEALARFCLRVMPRLTAILFAAAGVILVADGIGWFAGRPLLPVTP